MIPPYESIYHTADKDHKRRHVNLGCGRDILAGWTNVDRFPGPGVDVVADMGDLPIPTESVATVYASHVLEHVIDFAAAWREIHRILEVGGLLFVRVPYGKTSDPFHAREFDEGSIAALTGPGGPVGYEGGNTSSLERDAGWFEAVGVRYLYSHDGFPRWHAWHYLRWEPFKKRIELQLWLRKRA